MVTPKHKYIDSVRKVKVIEAELDKLFKDREFTKRRTIIPLWKNAYVKRNKLEKAFLKEVIKDVDTTQTDRKE